MAGRYFIGIDLGGTNLKAALIGADFKIKSKELLSTPELGRKEGLIAAIVSAVFNLISKNNLKKKDILGVGLGLPGPIDSLRGIVHFFPNIPGWKQVRLKDMLSRKIRLPVFIDNDAKMMALAEFTLGEARRFKNVLCLTLGTGIGGGLILDGRLYRGQDNAAGEFGHIPLNESGPRCNCGGIACIESYIGNRKILKLAKEEFGPGITLEEVSRRANKGQVRAVKLWQAVGRKLGITISGVVTFLNLDAVVIGGGVANAGKVLFDEINRAICERAMNVQSARAKVLKAKLGNDAGVIGAAILVKESLK